MPRRTFEYRSGHDGRPVGTLRVPVVRYHHAMKRAPGRRIGRHRRSR